MESRPVHIYPAGQANFSMSWQWAGLLEVINELLVWVQGYTTVMTDTWEAEVGEWEV